MKHILRWHSELSKISGSWDKSKSKKYWNTTLFLINVNLSKSNFKVLNILQKNNIKADPTKNNCRGFIVYLQTSKESNEIIFNIFEYLYPGAVTQKIYEQQNGTRESI